MSVFRQNVLEGKICFVTGGASGIGKEISRQLVAHGARVMIFGRRLNKLEEAARELRCEFSQGDVRKVETVRAALDKLGRVDVLVNCAAGNFLCLAEDLSPNGFSTVLDIDTKGVFNVSKTALPHLKRAGRSVIINISATLHYGATQFQVHASAAKAAIDAVTRNLALEWKPYGIRCVGVAPGPIKGTPGMAKLAPGGIGDDENYGDKEDIAFACVYLASEAAKFITGDTLIVDGGAWLRPQPMVPLEVYKALKAKM